MGRMISLRLDPDLDAQVRRAASREGTSVSEFIRRAAAERAANSLDVEDRFKGIIGQVHSGGGVAERSSDVFGEMLEEEFDR